ncbi:uncharacterized protein LOC123300263 [Chrysoperla carnea]|uniref:uncharacterized protein LOC123300263 n=1 Tax=Chrysoperla carnea TaxID=189513 RepID=UPI001D068212|nr:uncharacterized protein LOC123300263 [Chrysoperla carnea]
MLKLFAIVVLLVQLLNEVQSDVDFTNNVPNVPLFFHKSNELCANVNCTEVKNCPPGEHYSWSRPDEGKCCQTCERDAKIDEKCDMDTLCGRNLLCPYPPEGKYSLEDVCVYPWENMKYSPKCDTSRCPTYKSCPKDSFLVQHDGEKTCCDQCIQYSIFGDFCDEKLPCVDGLKCTDNICKESEKCLEEKPNCKVINDCGSKGFLKPADGLDRCCDECLPFAKTGDECDYKDAICEVNSYCEYSTGKCVESKFDCSKFPCGGTENESDCKGVWVPADGINICCPYCIPYANYGSYCDEKNLCNPEVFVCRNYTCDVKECNCI